MRILLGFVAVSFFVNFAWSFDHSHAAWTEILQEQLTTREAASCWDYEGLQKKPDKLQAYLKTLEGVSAKDFEEFPETQRLAFLINAYNAQTVSYVIQHYPIKDVFDPLSTWETIRMGVALMNKRPSVSPWTKHKFPLLGEPSNLDRLEHERILKNYDEPRVHFAINCAAIGCPKLLNTAYRGVILGEQLDASTRTFLADTTRNRHLGQGRVALSKIMSDWFKEDFEKGAGLKDFLLKYMPLDAKQKEELLYSELKVESTPYDWDLNDLKNEKCLGNVIADNNS